MARQKRKPADAPSGNGASLKELLRELWAAAVTLRGSNEPADSKRYVLPISVLQHRRSQTVPPPRSPTSPHESETRHEKLLDPHPLVGLG